MTDNTMRRIADLLADLHGAVLATRNPDGTLDQFYVWAAVAGWLKIPTGLPALSTADTVNSSPARPSCGEG